MRERAGRRAGLGAGEEELASLDPTLRRLRGVYATPQPVVAWVVRSIDELLRSGFEKPRGLADGAVRLLDPCAGPMNFLLEAWRVAVTQGERYGLQPASLVERHLLPHSRGIEIVPELFERGRAEVAIWLARYGVRVGEGGRFPLDLADALSDAELGDEAWPGFLGGAGHSTSPALPVVLGNPPYRGRSANRGARILELLHGYRLADGREDDGYYRVDGHGLGERNPKWLQDDAVKFLRVAQWTVDRAGRGLVAFVLNHNFIDAPTFRGLRASLQRTFGEIYALDLHGNRRKRERQSEGSPDENVFRGVAQGVAILLLVKRSGLARRMLRADLYGDRQAKLCALADGSVSSTVWTEVRPRSPSYLFVVGEGSRERRYRDGVALPEIFSVSTTGVITGRDAVLTDLDRGALEERLATPQGADAGASLDAAGLAMLRADRWWQRRIAPLLVRPFDMRQVIYAEYLLARPRRAVMEWMLPGDNLGLVVARQCKEAPGALVAAWLVGHKVVSAYDVNTLFPLFVRCEPAASADRLPRIPNLRPGLRRRLAVLYGREVDPGFLFAYLYGVLYSPPYRTRYRRMLQRDYPRIPFPRSVEAFERVGGLGQELMQLHLLRDERLLRPAVTIQGASGRPLARSRSVLCRYHASAGRIELDEHGFCFEGVAPEVWQYRIGGHQVLKRWLQARRGRVLRHRDLSLFRWAAEALRLTLGLEAPLAEAYRDVEDDRATLDGEER